MIVYLDSVRARVLLIAVLGAIAFGWTFTAGFMWDDHEMIEKNQAIRRPSFAGVSHLLTHDVFEGKGNAYYRPAQALMNLVDYQVWRGNPIGFHFTNWAFHVGTALLLFYLAGLLLNNRDAAFLSAALFVIHPVVVEQLLIIAGRAELMAACFGLASVALALRREPLARLASIFAFALACFSKESAIVFPVVTWAVGKKLNKKMPLWLLAGWGTVAAGYLIIRAQIVPTPTLAAPQLSLFAIRDLPAILVHYARLIVVPFDLHSHRRFEPGLLNSVLSGAILVFGLVWARRSRQTALLWGAAWFGLHIIPRAPVLATSALVLDHWAYLSTAAVTVGLAVWATRGLRRGRTLPAALVGATAIFWITAANWNSAGRNTDEKLYRWALRYPTSSVVRYNYALLKYQRGEFAAARSLVEESLQMNPTNTGSKNLLSLVRWELGEEGAIEDLKEFAGAAGEPSVWMTVAELYRRKNRLPEALEAYSRVLEKDPDHVAALINAGGTAATLKKYRDARRYWERAARLDPMNRGLANNLAWLDKQLPR